MQNKALGLLGIANKGGNIEIGEDPVGYVAHQGTARLIILASDAADHSIRRARSYASLHDTPVVQIPENKEELGGIFGRRSVAMLAVTEINLAERFLGLLPEPEKYEAQITAVREKAKIMRERKQRKPGTRGPKGKK